MMPRKKSLYHLEKLASRIKKHRADLSLSREELADRACVNYNTIIKLESGDNQNPTISTLIAIAEAFRVPVDKLIL